MPRIEVEDPTKPHQVVLPHGGSATLLGNTGSLATDVFNALIGAGCPHAFSIDDVVRLIRCEHVRRGLRAEAGHSNGPMIVIFYTRTELLASGKRVGAWLTLMRTPRGDALCWNIGITSDGNAVLSLADDDGVKELFTMLRAATGGPSSDIRAYRAEIPTDDEIARD